MRSGIRAAAIGGLMVAASLTINAASRRNPSRARFSFNSLANSWRMDVTRMRSRPFRRR